MVRAMVRVRRRDRGGEYFLRLHTPFSIVGLARWPYSTIRLGGYSSGAAFLPNPSISSPCMVRLTYRVLVETELAPP